MVQQLEDAGAIVAGKTNLDEFGMGSHSLHSRFGPVTNIRRDHDSDHLSAGGSSGGSAIAVASGQCFLYVTISHEISKGRLAHIAQSARNGHWRINSPSCRVHGNRWLQAFLRAFIKMGCCRVCEFARYSWGSGERNLNYSRRFRYAPMTSMNC